MAKQVGLFGLRGKIENKSFYKTTGVSDTIIRGIPEGLSERVKTSEEYANTRLNNKEFGAACNAAGILGQLVVPKFRPMVLPFSQSKMAKDLLLLARQNSDDWGQRTLAANQVQQICDALNATSKRSFDEFVSANVSRTSATAGDVTTAYTADQAALMSSIGIDSITVTARVYDVATGKWNDVVKEMATGYFDTKDVVSPFENQAIVAGTPDEASESFITDLFVPAPNHAGMQIVVLVFMPARTINGTAYTLQEYCSFKAMPIPASE